MRVFHIINSLSAGGAERQFSYLASELARMGHDVHVAYCHEGPDKPALPGVILHRLKSSSNYDPYLLWQLIQLVRYVRPDIIQTWTPPQMDILGSMAAILCSKRYIFREPGSGLLSTQMWKNHLRVMMGKKACAVISNSQGGDEYWKSRVTDKRRHVILNALPVDEIDKTLPAFPPKMREPDFPVVLYAGRMVKEQKRADLFLETLACAKRKKKIFGVLCGEGPQMHELEMLRDELGLNDDVLFTGHLLPKDIWALMKKASVLVSLSSYEGCPNSVIEAMACGCPLIVSDIPAHREILDETCAVFVNPSDVHGTADIIVQALDDAPTAKKRALTAKQKIPDRSIATMALNYEKVYTECLQTGHASL